MMFVDDLASLDDTVYMDRGWGLEGSTTTPSTFVKSMTKGTTDTTPWPHTVNVPVHCDCLVPPLQTVIAILVCIQQIKAGENVPSNSHGHHMARNRVLRDDSPYQFGDNMHMHVSTDNCSAGRSFVPGVSYKAWRLLGDCTKCCSLHNVIITLYLQPPKQKVYVVGTHTFAVMPGLGATQEIQITRRSHWTLQLVLYRWVALAAKSKWKSKLE